MTRPSFLSLAAAAEVFTVATPDGARLPVYALAGPPGAPALLFGHANGLAAGCYEPFFRRLAKDVRIFAFDARGHGGSTWPEGPFAQVFGADRMAADLDLVTRAVAARVPGGALAYAGHSLGGATALRLASTAAASPWTALVLFEPPVLPPPDAACHATAVAAQERLVAGTLRRRTDWASPEALFARLQGAGMFSRFRPELLLAHCRATLRPKPEGGFTLCCPPPIESWIYESHLVAATFELMARIAGPVTLVGGDPATADPLIEWISDAMPDIAAGLPQGQLATVPRTGHMLIFEEPEICADLLLAGIGLG